MSPEPSMVLMRLNQPKQIFPDLCLIVLIGTGLTYIMLNTCLTLRQTIETTQYNRCISQLSQAQSENLTRYEQSKKELEEISKEDETLRTQVKCPNPAYSDGASNVFYLLFGWFPAFLYSTFISTLHFFYFQEHQTRKQAHNSKYCLTKTGFLILLKTLSITTLALLSSAILLTFQIILF